ncbi:MAG: hypothetical protein KF745_12865 [Phycisphaeraceae bacterium]|nr:hypothetical protein [Phycisphaeraceae bacterium]
MNDTNVRTAKHSVSSAGEGTATAWGAAIDSLPAASEIARLLWPRNRVLSEHGLKRLSQVLLDPIDRVEFVDDVHCMVEHFAELGVDVLPLREADAILENLRERLAIKSSHD